MSLLRPSVIRRFWAKVNKTDDESSCWLWTGSLNTWGYGQLNAAYHKRVSSHRLSYLLHYGVLPSDKLVCHTCNNKACVNPKHLYLGNHTTNGLDAVRDGLTPSGSSHYNFRADESFLSKVKELSAQGETQKKIARIMECHPSLISRLLNGKSRSKDRNKVGFKGLVTGLN